MPLFRKSIGVVLSLWPQSPRHIDFWEVFALSSSVQILTGPCQVLKGVTGARTPTSQAPEGCCCQLAPIPNRDGWLSVALCVWSWPSSLG